MSETSGLSALTLEAALRKKEQQAKDFRAAIEGEGILIDSSAELLVHEALNVSERFQLPDQLLLPNDPNFNTFELREVSIREFDTLLQGDLREIYKKAFVKGYRLCPPDAILEYKPKAPVVGIGMPTISLTDPDHQRIFSIENDPERGYVLKGMIVDHGAVMPADTVLLFYVPKQPTPKVAQ